MSVENFDPLEIVGQINWPWPTNVEGRSVSTPFITIWHVDPGVCDNDDSCYEGMRAYYSGRGEVDGYPGQLDQMWWFNKALAWRLHFWHWRVQIHPLQNLKRWLSSRCDYCGEGFAWGEIPVTTHDDPYQNNQPGWLWSERDVFHSECFSEYYAEEKYGDDWNEMKAELEKVREKQE